MTRWLLQPQVPRDALFELARQRDWRAVGEEHRIGRASFVWDVGDAVHLSLSDGPALGVRYVQLTERVPEVAHVLSPYVELMTASDAAAKASSTRGRDRLRWLAKAVMLSQGAMSSELLATFQATMEDAHIGLWRGALHVASGAEATVAAPLLEWAAERFDAQDERRRTAVQLLLRQVEQAKLDSATSEAHIPLGSVPPPWMISR